MCHQPYCGTMYGVGNELGITNNANYNSNPHFYLENTYEVPPT